LMFCLLFDVLSEENFSFSSFFGTAWC